MNTLELQDKKAVLKNEANAIIENCRAEKRFFNEAEQEKIDGIKAEIEKTNTELRKLSEEVALSDNNQKFILNEKKTMEKRFSLIKAIRDVAENRSLDALTENILNEGREEMRKAGISYSGNIQLPSAEYRAMTVGDEGEDVVATDLMDIVRPLQAKNVLINAGAKFVTGLVGDVQYPVMSAANAGWATETGAATDAGISFSNVKMSPKRLTVVVPISKQFLAQDSVGAENAIREEIVNAVNAKLEKTILGSEAGSTTQPEGLFYNFSGDAITDFSGLVDAEAGIEEANIYGDLKYVMSPKAKAKLRAMAKGSKSTQLVYEGGEVDGTPALVTSNVANYNFLYGDFSQLVIGQWSALDIVTDVYTLAANGQVRLVVNAFFDAKLLRDGAIVRGKLG